MSFHVYFTCITLKGWLWFYTEAPAEVIQASPATVTMFVSLAVQEKVCTSH